MGDVKAEIKHNEFRDIYFTIILQGATIVDNSYSLTYKLKDSVIAHNKIESFASKEAGGVINLKGHLDGLNIHDNEIFGSYNGCAVH